MNWKLTPESGELLHLDGLRFIAAGGIVLIHSQGMIAPAAAPLHFAIFVDLFFLISGYVIGHVYAGRINEGRDYRAFLLRRVARLAPLHWATLAAFLILSLAAAAAGLPINTPEMFDLRCLPANAAFLHALGLCQQATFNGPSWSIGAEAIMYLATPAVFLVVGRPRVALVALLSLWALLFSFAGEHWLGWQANGGAVRALPSFLLGVLLHQERARLAAIPRPAALCLVAVIGIVAGGALGFPAVVMLALAYLAGICGMAADLRGHVHPAVRAIAPLGQLTYSIYMLHMLVLVVANFTGRSLLGLDGAAHVAFMVGCVLATFPLAYLSLKLFEMPARHWIVRAAEARRPRAGPLREARRSGSESRS